MEEIDNRFTRAVDRFIEAVFNAAFFVATAIGVGLFGYGLFKFDWPSLAGGTVLLFIAYIRYKESNPFAKPWVRRAGVAITALWVASLVARWLV